MAKKMRIGVLMGGVSAERDVSLVTGRAVSENLNKKKYQVLPIEIDAKGKFYLNKGYYRQLNTTSARKKTTARSLQALEFAAGSKTGGRLDLVFIALHGTMGEDGAVQGMLETLGIPYTGSGILASALAMHKDKAADVYRAHGLPTPDFVAFSKKDWQKRGETILNEIKLKIGLPAVLKPTDQGSAVGVTIVHNQADLLFSIKKTVHLFPQVMVQRFIRGQEATCGVLEKDGEPFALPPTHILPNYNQFYDYASKYQSGGSTHICPADFPDAINKKIQELAVRAHVALGCRGMSRTDIFYGDDGKLWVIETNTIPGMTPTSLLPEAAGKAGIGFKQMLDMIIKATVS